MFDTPVDHHVFIESFFACHNHAQAFRPVHKNQKPSTTSASLDSDDVTFIDCHTDPENHKDFILWVDIQQAFDEALLVTHKTKMLAFLKGPDDQTLEPRRIAAVSGIVLDVVVGGELPVLDVKIAQDLSIFTPPPSRITHDSVQYSGVSVCDNGDSELDEDDDIPGDMDKGFYGLGLGVSKDGVKAFNLALKAVHRSGGSAESTLGSLYRGSVFIPQDGSTAFEWFVKGAEQGNKNCQYEVAKSYEKGKDIPADREKAIEWYTEASQNGHPQAKSDLERLTAQ
ncbi:MAG: hypothetical protein J3R72DRAFT_479876 [Linnemannia gamsii]|nr:MAG: hypothetical protein J3R72DRAFT_479876 [Linnemannia gamsii]